MRLRLTFALLLASGGACAQAGPPMITNDPDTPGPGVWEINIAATGARVPGGFDLDAPDVDINRGVGERMQLSLHASWAHGRSNGAWRSGLGDVEFGLRYRFLDAATDGVSMAVQPLYVRGWSAAARRRGLASENAEWVLPLQVARPFGEFNVGLEVARHFVADEADAWQGGMFVSRDCFGGDCLAEINSTRVDGQSVRTTLNVGARRPLREGLLMMGSVGSEVTGRDRAPLVFYVGLQYVR
ncbi:hypothetical protein [Cognatilysobacter segetis]|uniref:hypothetical protein n=1 Tax=Cognatilysobacter segetis TaxID=2492394 RepID=UPI00105BF766|nr:hypothetical protein [Lysobacter segetis]